MRTEGQASRRLTARAPLEGTRSRVGLGWEMEVDFAEIVFEVDGRLNIANVEACVDPADHFEFGTDFEDAVMHLSVDRRLPPYNERFQRAPTWGIRDLECLLRRV